MRLERDSLAFRVYEQREIEEEFFCNYELNPSFQAALQDAGLRITGRGERGEARIVELPGHRFFLASLFLPQLSSTKERPHPLITKYLEAALKFRARRV
ncbi:MAG: hypothetical protein HY000_28250 [Planctomycetes bacterium]|nr:hypothetical protein [Planctomycetota bacterium]